MAEEVIYPTAWVDGDGKPLDGASRYVLHFEKDKPPSHSGVWSVSAYRENQAPGSSPTGADVVGGGGVSDVTHSSGTRGSGAAAVDRFVDRRQIIPEW
jgi:hypothetical protein